jgi:hypothetical protein
METSWIWFNWCEPHNGINMDMVRLVRTALWKQVGYGSTGANRIMESTWIWFNWCEPHNGINMDMVQLVRTASVESYPGCFHNADRTS